MNTESNTPMTEGQATLQRDVIDPLTRKIENFKAISKRFPNFSIHNGEAMRYLFQDNNGKTYPLGARPQDNGDILLIIDGDSIGTYPLNKAMNLIQAFLNA